MMKKFDKRLLDKYFNNQCTVKEARIVLNWLNTREGQQWYAGILDERIKNAEINSENEFQREVNDQKTLTSIYETSERLQQKKRTLRPHTFAKSSGVNQRVWFGIAAACVVFLMLTVVYRLYFNSTIIHRTNYGETKTVKLQDGSTVTVNANSKLSYSRDWNPDTPREVWLEGEAYFQIRHLESHQKFLVHTQNLDIEVLGTEFNVYHRRQETSVVLNSGKVKLDLHADMAFETPDLTMQPSELVIFSEGEKRVEKKVVNPEVYISWVNNVLIFDDMPVGKIAEMIEDNFGLEVIIQSPAIRHMRFNAEIPAKDLELLLTLLEQSFGLTIEKKDKNVIISTNRQDGQL